MEVRKNERQKKDAINKGLIIYLTKHLILAL